MIHKVPSSFHVKKQYGWALRDIYSPLVDEVNNEVYVWTQKINQVEIYQLDVETGELIKKINLESYKNIQKHQIENGYLYFLYDEQHYPYATRLYSMAL